MPRKYNDIKSSALKNVAEFMATAARTAPKTRGIDHLEIILLTKTNKEKVIKAMRRVARRDSRPSCGRDASSIKDSEQILVIGVKKVPLGLNCGFCGYPTCKDLNETQGVCAYNAMDLGIALGSACSVAGRFHIDNRLMYSIGKGAMEAGVLKKNIVQAIGIPLSATGKNPFFDRK